MLTERGVRGWLLLAVVALLAQEALTAHPDTQRGSRIFWAVLSLGLLWFVHRRSNVARILFAVIATVGFVIYVLGAIDDPTSTSTLLAPLYAVQAATMLVRPVRAWTRAQSGGQVPAGIE